MIHINVAQGSREWLEAKAGVVSASNLHRVMTPKTLKLSASADGYMHELLAEQLIGRPLDDATTDFMQRGTDLEKTARDWYAMQRDVDVEQVGFLVRDDGRVGCSPDGLIGLSGGLEIKCPSAAAHVGYLLEDIGEKYKCQIQGALWITGRDWWDFVSYNPELPSLLLRFQRDEEFIAALSKTTNQFLNYLDESKLKLQRLGLFSDFQRPALKIA